MVNPSVQLDSARGGKSDLETGDVVEREAEEFEPICESIARQKTESSQLIQTRTEVSPADGVVEVMRNVTDAGSWRAVARLAGYIGQGQSALREQGANLIDQSSDRPASGSCHGLASASRKLNFVEEKCRLAVITDRPVVRNPKQRHIVEKTKKGVC
jgi:hypothetical protein